MAYYFGGISAFRFWRSQGNPRSAYQRSRPASLETNAHDFEGLEGVCARWPLAFGGKVHLCVGADANRKRMDRVSFSVSRPPLPQGSFLRVTDNLYVASPELCFLQMARKLTRIQLMKFGMELCGSYQVDPENNELQQRKLALTSTKKIASFLERSSGQLGARRAKAAAAWMMDGAASPEETQLALCFRIPRKSGGQGLGVPLLNYRVAMNAAQQHIAGKSCYYVDEFWPAGNLAVEYESDAFHSSSYKKGLDRRRRNLIQELGMRVITVNTAQLKNPLEMDDLAKQIAHHLQLQRRAVSAGYERKHFEAHQQIVYISPIWRL